MDGVDTIHCPRRVYLCRRRAYRARRPTKWTIQVHNKRSKEYKYLSISLVKLNAHLDAQWSQVGFYQLAGPILIPIVQALST